MSLLNDAPRTADVIAVGTVSCLFLHRSVFVDLFPNLESKLRTASSQYKARLIQIDSLAGIRAIACVSLPSSSAKLVFEVFAGEP